MVMDSAKNIGMGKLLRQPKDFPVIFRMYQLNFDGNTDFIYKKYWDESCNHFIEKI